MGNALIPSNFDIYHIFSYFSSIELLQHVLINVFIINKIIKSMYSQIYIEETVNVSPVILKFPGRSRGCMEATSKRRAYFKRPNEILRKCVPHLRSCALTELMAIAL